MFDEDNQYPNKNDLNIPPRRHTTEAQQTRPILPVPIVYH